MNTVSIWKDKIILNWDGALPPNAPSGSIHERKDVLHFWPEIKDYARWNDRVGGFMLSFGKQNLQRIHRQFGSIPLKSGKDRITELKAINNNFVEMVHSMQRLKELQDLPPYEFKVPPLADYQRRGVTALRFIKRVPLLVGCGGGKSYMVLTSTEWQIRDGAIQPGKTLICGKLSTLETGWLEDAASFTNLKIINLWLPQCKHRKEKIIELINTPADAYVINHDGVRVFEEALAAKNFQKVVVDESTILKGFHGMDNRIKGGQFGRALMNVSHSADWRVIMSGTPAPNGPKDLWGQYYFLDPQGLLLESSFRDFMARYYDIIDLRPKHQRHRPLGMRDPKKEEPKKGAIDEIAKLTNPLSYRIRIRDHLKDLPPLTVMRRNVEMGVEQRKHYETMKHLLKVELEDARISVSVQLAKLMKLRQITGGFIIDHEEKAHAIDGNPKLAELDSLLNEEFGPEEKVVIYAEYRHEIETILNRYPNTVSVYGGNSSQINLDNIKRFRTDPNTRITVMHPKAAAHGITLTMSRLMVFFSISYSFEDNFQCVKRVDRAGQKSPMSVYYLTARDSIDDTLYKTLQLKELNQEKLIDQDKADLRLLEAWRK